MVNIYMCVCVHGVKYVLRRNKYINDVDAPDAAYIIFLVRSRYIGPGEVGCRVGMKRIGLGHAAVPGRWRAGVMWAAGSEESAPRGTGRRRERWKSSWNYADVYTVRGCPRRAVPGEKQAIFPRGWPACSFPLSPWRWRDHTCESPDVESPGSWWEQSGGGGIKVSGH